MALLEVGDKAPDFTTIDQDGQRVKLSDFRGKKVVLYFYPKDDTPGCTKEACSFRDGWSAFRRRKIEVLGVSAQDEKSHKKFAEKFSLHFRLLADAERKIVEAYGVWGEKSLYGRKFMGIERSTFLVDSNGKLVREWRKVKVKGHAAEVLEAAKQL